MNALKLQIRKGQLHLHDQSRQARVAEWSAVDGNLRVEPGSHPVILLQSGFVAGAALNRVQGVADVPFIRNETVTDKVQLVVVFDLRVLYEPVKVHVDVDIINFQWHFDDARRIFGEKALVAKDREGIELAVLLNPLLNYVAYPLILDYRPIIHIWI